MANLSPEGLRITLGCAVLLVCISLAVSCGDIDTEAASLTISPASATVGISQSKQFSVIAKNSAGFIVDVTPTWSVSGSIGSINSSGLFTAGASTGSGTVVAAAGDISNSAAVTLTDKCWIEGRITGEQDPGGVQNILVTLRGTAMSDRTDSSGDYSVSNVPAGTYDVYTQEDHPIYLSSSQEVTVSSGETATRNFYLTVRPGTPTVPTTTFPTF